MLGQIVENDKKDASSEFRIRFENDEDDEPEEMCIGESDTLSKMVRLANVVPAARLAIYWPDDEMYYPATVLQERRQNSKAFFVQYDDGMHEWINLWGNEFQLLSEDEDPAMMNRPRLRQRPATMGPRRRKSADDALGTTRRTKRKQTARSELFRDGGEPEADHSPQRRKRRTRNDGDANWVSSSGRTKRRRREVDRFGMGDNGDSKSDVERRKLGRPFQDRNSEDDGINDEESNSGFEEAAEAPKRKRGRPKGTSSEHTRMPLSGTVKKDLGATGRVKRSQSMVSKSLKVKGDVVGDGDSATETEISEGQSCKSTRGSDLVDSDEESSPRKRTKSSPRKRTKRVTQLEDVSVGVRVSVYWTDDEKFFTGTVTKHRSGKKPFYVEYDDGDNEWLDLEQQTFRIVQRGRFQLEPYSPSASRDASHDEPTPRRKTPRKKAETIDSPSAGKTTSPPRKRRGSHTTSPVKTNDVDMSKIVVGTRVAVWWPEDRRYYKGVVTRKQPEANWRPFFLEYDDGDEEWIDFRHHKFRILSKAEEESPASPVVRKDGRSADISQVWIGSRLSVWWPEEKEYFDCTVTRYRDHRRSFYLEYDDGDREWIDLADTDFFIVDSSSRRRRISK